MDMVTSPYANMRNAVSSVISSHAAIRQEISKKAAEHEAKLERMRKEANIQASIREGITRANG